ncbi:MAG: hypothetical protein ABFR50_08260 [Candidatus Fermentibacteria bacterium]
MFLWFSVLGLLSWTVILSAIVELSSILKSERIWHWIVQVSTIAVIVFSILNTASIWNKHADSPYDPLSCHDEKIMVLSDFLNSYLSSQNEHSWVITPVEHDLWPVMTGLVNSLDKQGWNVSVSSDFAFMTGTGPGVNDVPLYITYNSGGIPQGTEILFHHENILICR